MASRIRRGRKTRTRRPKHISLMDVTGLSVGEYLTLSDGTGNTENFMSTVQNPNELLRQQIIGLTGYDIQSKGWSVDNLVRFYGPVVAFKILKYVGKKLVGPVKISKKFKVF